MWVKGEWTVGRLIVGIISIKYGLYGLKHHIVEISGDVTDAGRQTVKIELLSQWMLEAEFRNYAYKILRGFLFRSAPILIRLLVMFLRLPIFTLCCAFLHFYNNSSENPKFFFPTLRR